jgi:hypothetical protein
MSEPDLPTVRLHRESLLLCAPATVGYVRPKGGSMLRRRAWLAGFLAMATSIGVLGTVAPATAGSIRVAGLRGPVGARLEVSSRGPAPVALSEPGRRPGRTTQSPPTYGQQAELSGPASSGFGFSVAIPGRTAVVGAPFENYPTGAAYIFNWSGSAWVQEQRLAPAAQLPESILGLERALSLGGRAFPSHGRGRRFKSSSAHRKPQASDTPSRDPFTLASRHGRRCRRPSGRTRRTRRGTRRGHPGCGRVPGPRWPRTRRGDPCAGQV